MVQLISRDLFAGVLEQANASPRRRMNFNFHQSMDENPHRFLNVLLRGTYITPHRHLDPPKSESFVVLEGRVAFLTFRDDGDVADTQILAGEGLTYGIDVPPGIWHSMVVISETAICFEVKPGPYKPMDDKEFAPWAPREGASDAAAYLARLSSLESLVKLS